MYLYFTEELTPKRLLSVSKEVSCSLNFLCSTSLLQNMQRIQTNIVVFFYLLLLLYSWFCFRFLFPIPKISCLLFFRPSLTGNCPPNLSYFILVIISLVFYSYIFYPWPLLFSFFPLGYNLSIFAGGLDVTLLKFFIAYFSYLLLDS